MKIGKSYKHINACGQWSKINFPNIYQTYNSKIYFIGNTIFVCPGISCILLILSAFFQESIMEIQTKYIAKSPFWEKFV